MLLAIYRTERGGSVTSTTTNNYTNKAEFTEELRGNGLRVIKVFTMKEVEEIKDMNELEIYRKYKPKTHEKIAFEYVQQVL